ncbi:DUF6708 domain-containing protein [Pseudomonas guariconensis]|uniref:DUF6708 domain-containing protein n=1 Tax=Pseudomonas guariconensis TaxID=1288410 RepID=UPI002E1A9FDA
MTLYTGKFLRRPIGWKHNLPAPNEMPKEFQGLENLNPPPSHIDHIYLEFPRSSFKSRGLSILLFPPLILMCALLDVAHIYLILVEPYAVSFIDIFVLCLSVLMPWLAIPFIRMEIEFPRDEPIRFNRLRRKVYFYHFKLDKFWVFSRRRWGVEPVAYDWDDLRAEAISIYLPMTGSGLIENIVISVIKPGTDEVIDRFFFAHDWMDGERYWAIIQRFMQQGPEALPDFVHPPRDGNNEATAFDFIPNFAPKVQWPEAMDLESRSAPLPPQPLIPQPMRSRHSCRSSMDG